jgi:hypothetical protein
LEGKDSYREIRKEKRRKTAYIASKLGEVITM